MGTVDGYLLALDGKTGKPVSGFGNDGVVDLGADWQRGVDRTMFTVTPPPVIVRDVVIVGSGLIDVAGPKDSIPPGTVRAFDVHTGETFGTFIPYRIGRVRQ